MGHLQHLQEGVRIRPMRPDELIEITKLIHSIFPSADAETRIKKGDVVFVAEADGRHVGFIHFSERSGTGAAGGSISVKGVGVIPEFRSKGVGSALIYALISKFGKSGKPFYLKVRSNNESALALYENEGFTVKRESKSGKFLLLVRMPEN